MKKWQIFSAVALRRLPELQPKKDIIESRVQEIFSTYEVGLSKLSNHELEEKTTSQDKEEMWNKQISSFSPAQHDQRLTLMQYLFMRQKFASDLKEQWLLPQAEYNPNKDNHLMDTAIRALKESLNIVNGYKMTSKIPSSVYSFKYSRKIADLTGAIGAKVFFIKAHIDSHDEFVLNKTDEQQSKDLKWLTREEAIDAVKVHKRYMTSLSQGLLHENRVDVNTILLKIREHE